MLAGQDDSEDIIRIKEPEKPENVNFNFKADNNVVNYGTDFDFGLDEIDRQLTSFRSEKMFDENDVKPVTLGSLELKKKTDSDKSESSNNCKNIEMSDMEIPPAPKMDNLQRYSSSSFDSVPLPRPHEMNGKMQDLNEVSEESMTDFDSRSSTTSESIDAAILTLQQRIQKFNDK